MAQSTRTWKSWLYLLLTVLGFTGVAILFAGGPIPLWLKLSVTGVWLAVTGLIAYMDWVKEQQAVVSDATPFDLWTISHTMAGVVFGVWFVPIWLVLVITILWEVFEAYVPGFGDKEVLTNRAVDVGVAVVGWLIVVSVTCLVEAGERFPLFTSEGGVLNL